MSPKVIEAQERLDAAFQTAQNGLAADLSVAIATRYPHFKTLMKEAQTHGVSPADLTTTYVQGDSVVMPGADSFPYHYAAGVLGGMEVARNPEGAQNTLHARYGILETALKQRGGEDPYTQQVRATITKAQTLLRTFDS